MRCKERTQRSVFTLLFLLFIIASGFLFTHQLETSQLTRVSSGYSVYPISSYAEGTTKDASWNLTFGGPGDDICYSLIEIETEGFALAGMTNSFGNSWNTWLIRTAANGTQLWDKTYNFTLSYNSKAFIGCKDGGFLFAGELIINYSSYTALLKIDAFGNPQWNKTYCLNRWPGRIAVVECHSGGFGLLTTHQINASECLWFLRTDKNGNPLWNQTYDAGGSVYASSILEVSTGGFLLVSQIEYSMDVWVVRTDTVGAVVWDVTYKSFGTPQECWSAIELSGGAIESLLVLAGYYGTRSLRSIWLEAVHPEGSKWWTQNFEYVNDNYGVNLVEVSNGGLAIIGSTSFYGAEEIDMWLIRTDFVGNLCWHRTLGGFENDWGVSLIEANNGQFALAGTTESFGVNQSDIWFLGVDDSLLWWVSEPYDIIMYRGMSLSYALEAAGFFEIDSWSINDTQHFSIDNQGVITDLRILDEGEYGIQINVTDTQGNLLTGTIKVTVLPGLLPPLPSISLTQIFVYIAVLDFVMIAILILLIRFKRHLFH